MLSSRIEFGALIDSIRNDFTEYLTHNTFELCDLKRKDDLCRYYSTARWHQVPNTDQYVVVHQNGDRNNLLTAKRIANVLDVQNELQKKHSELKNDGDDIPQKLSEIQILLVKKLELNNEYSTQHQKTHRSYNENLLSKKGFFGSWWHKTWFQSRATRAFETALENLASFKRAIQPSNKFG